MNRHHSAVGSPEWYAGLDTLPTPLVRPLELYAAALGNEPLRWTACRDFCTLALSLLHGLALAARNGMDTRPAPRVSGLPFPRFQKRLDWMNPSAILHAWGEINPGLPKAARLPMDRAVAFPELHTYADERGLARPTHAVEALAVLQALANDIAKPPCNTCACKPASATLDAILSRLAFRELRFLARWMLAVRLPAPDDAREATLHHALVLRGPAPRCTALPEGMRNAPATRVVALSADSGPALNLYPFCILDAPPDPGTALGADSEALSCWPAPQMLLGSTDMPRYRCATSGACFVRPELAASVTAAVRGRSAALVGKQTRWGLLWVGIRGMRGLNEACTHSQADKILLAMDLAAARWSAPGGGFDGEGPVAYPFWRHADELAIPFRYTAGTDPSGAVQGAAASVVAAAVGEALACGIGIPWPTCEADQDNYTPTAGPLKLSVGFTLDAGVTTDSHEPFSRRMIAELAHLRQSVHELLDRRKELNTNAPLLWIGREGVSDQWRACVTPLFARISEAAFAIIRNAADPSQWLVRRNRHRGNYNLIGGHLEAMDGNDGLALIRREIGEELGLRMKSSELRPLSTAPVHALEYSDRSRCMTLYIAHFFEATLSPDRFDDAACQAHRCRWIPAAQVLAPADGETTDIARFPARLILATGDGSSELRHVGSLSDWTPLAKFSISAGAMNP